jgi:hypothetical protein
VARSECTACGLVFTSVSSFDMHRVGGFGDPIYDRRGRLTGYSKPTRRCLTLDEMRTKGMVQTEKGQWSTGIDVRFTDVA